MNYDTISSRTSLETCLFPSSARRHAELQRDGAVWRWLREQVLAPAGTEGRASTFIGGSVQAVALRLTFEQLQEELLSIGTLTLHELKQWLALLTSPAFTDLSQLTGAAWGRKPSPEPIS